MAAKFGDLVKRHRKHNRMNQEMLSRELGIDRTTISKWESGSSIPSISDVKNLAKTLDVKASDLIAAAEATEADRNLSIRNLSITGKYELFQWAYHDDARIMKTNISVQSSGAKKRFKFEEQIAHGKQVGIIKGTVSAAFSNIFLYGKSVGQFKEFELIVANMPRKKDVWLPAVVAGVSSDDKHFPSASPAVLNYLGDEEFHSVPQYLPPSDAQSLMPLKFWKYISSKHAQYPIISARSLE